MAPSPIVLDGDGLDVNALDINVLATLLADAFFDNPAHTYIYSDPKTRRAKLTWLMRTNLRAQLHVGKPFGAVDGAGAVKAIAFWHPPGAENASLLTLARYGFFSMPFRQGVGAFLRMLKSVSAIEARRDRALDGRDSWYLNNMVVASSARGKGVGSKILRQALATQIDPSGAPASLTTQKRTNVRFYEALGFRVADNRPITDEKGLGFENWIMVYEP